MNNRVAVSLGLADTEACLSALGELGSRIGLAEIRLDLLERFDLPRLIEESPCPLIITCRPEREGGRFSGSEKERIKVLATAMSLGCSYVDIEWDSVEMLIEQRGSNTKLLVSRHWFGNMPSSLLREMEALEAHADAVKLVGQAQRFADALPVFDLLKRATKPVVGLAMGRAGQLTRLLAPCFKNCLLTYGAVNEASVTAPGQLSVNEMVEVYGLHRAGPHTSVYIHLSVDSESARAAIERNSPLSSGQRLHVALPLSEAEAIWVAPGLIQSIPNLTLSADSRFGAEIRSLCHRSITVRQ